MSIHSDPFVVPNVGSTLVTNVPPHKPLSVLNLSARYLPPSVIGGIHHFAECEFFRA
jgi:hypothetical protein